MQKLTIEPITVSVEQAMKLTSLGRNLLYERIADRSILSVKAGRRRLILVSSLNEYIHSLIEKDEDK